MMKRTRILLVVSCMTFVVMLLSCKKDSFTTYPADTLRFTADSIRFDTVFTGVGSVTKSFKIINDHDQKIRIASIQLMGGNTSAFSMNVNGQANSELKDYILDANDSIYVFVSVHINPNSVNVPFIVNDSISIRYNGNEQYVQLQAYGKNAHFIRNQTITGNQTWVNDLPYVIEGDLHIDTLAHLQMEAGCSIYMHANGRILVDGQLTAIGQKNNEIQFKGDRLDAPYRNLPGTWPGIYFRNESHDNELTFVVIQSAQQAIMIEGASNNNLPKLNMQQCVIDNASIAGIHATGSDVSMNNSLVRNCGKDIFIEYGGHYAFTNCTLVAYSNPYAYHQDPVVNIADYQTSNGNVLTADCYVSMSNCVIWGDGGTITDEINVDKAGNLAFYVILANSLFKSISDPNHTQLTGSIKNIDPLFDSIDPGNNYFDFHIRQTAASPLLDAGLHTNFLFDLDGVARETGAATDIGCFEKQ